jgi:hypothetical protein
MILFEQFVSAPQATLWNDADGGPADPIDVPAGR